MCLRNSLAVCASLQTKPEGQVELSANYIILFHATLGLMVTSATLSPEPNQPSRLCFVPQTMTGDCTNWSTNSIPTDNFLTSPCRSFSIHCLRCCTSFSRFVTFSSVSTRSFALALSSASSSLGIVARALLALLNSYCWKRIRLIYISRKNVTLASQFHKMQIATHSIL